MKIFSTVLLVTVSALTLYLSYASPAFFADNTFVNQFVETQLLGILAIIMTVTIASVSNIHLTFNRIEAKYGNLGAFKNARVEVNSGARWLVLLFILALAILVVRSYALTHPSLLCLLNGACLVILLFYILVLADITLTIFTITPHDEQDHDEDAPN